MIEPRVEIQDADDGYPVQVVVWAVPTGVPILGKVLVIHGVQSHSGWYHRLGRSLAEAGFETSFPDRRGSGANQIDRGHVESAGRFIEDVAGQLRRLKVTSESIPAALIGISWGAKIAIVTASKHPDLVRRVAMVCPGLHARVGVSFRERLQIAWAFFTNRRKEFPVPLGDPALFTDSPEGQAFIAADPLSLRVASAGLLASSTFLDRMVRKAQSRVKHPTLLMLGGRDRIVNNAKTLEYFERLASIKKSLIEYPDGHHTLEFDPDPDQYARDLITWLKEGPTSVPPK